MSKSSTTNSNQTTNGTTSLTQMPTNPAWVDQGLSGLGGAATNLAAQDPYSFVAPANANLTQAGATAANLTPNNGMYAGSNDLATSVGQASAPDIASLMNSFKNPWQKQVVDSTLAGFDQNAGYTRAADTLAKAGDSTFGGSGGAIQTALNEQNIGNARSQLQSGLETQGFNTALQGATSQAQAIQNQYAQRLAAAGQITGNANSQTAAANTDLGTQANIGSILQQLQQARAGAPINSLGSISSIFDGLPLGLEHGTNSNGTMNSNTSGTSTTNTSDPLGSLGSILQGAGSLGGLGALAGFTPFGLMGSTTPSSQFMGTMVSDRRAKTDIKRVGELDNGLGIFTYKYKGGGPRQMGVMAQDVQKVNPGAVRNIGGLLAVDYGKVA
jgi:hypothetical protein